MKQKKVKSWVVFALALIIAIAAVFPGAGSVSASSSKEVKQLKKLQKKLKKSKKFTKSFKTEAGGTESIEWKYLKHNAKITRSGNNIVFTDNVTKYYGKNINEKDVIKMSMKVGSNKKVKVSIKQTYYESKWNKDYTKVIGIKKSGSASYTTTIEPAKYKYGDSLQFVRKKEKTTDSDLSNRVYLSLRCWNTLIDKKADVTMSSIGFKKFKVIKDITGLE
jgi:hypothetical protein